MSASTFVAYSGDTSALTSPLGTVASGTSTSSPKTILQVRPGTTGKIRIIEWGFGFDALPPENARVELVETGTVYATVTAHTSGSIIPWADVGASSHVQLGTSATGYDASGEGTITETRLLDFTYESGLYVKRQYPLGREPEVDADHALRVRVTPGSTTAINMWSYLVWEE